MDHIELNGEHEPSLLNLGILQVTKKHLSSRQRLQLALSHEMSRLPRHTLYAYLGPDNRDRRFLSHFEQETSYTSVYRIQFSSSSSAGR